MKRIVTLIVCFFSFLAAEELPEQRAVALEVVPSASHEASSLAFLEGEPSAVVNQCVNAITGSFFDVQTDIVLPGIKPLAIERNYSSLDHQDGSLCINWHFNHACKLSQGLTVTQAGSSFSYEKISEKPQQIFGIRKGFLNKWITNCASGKIGGRTNIKNNRLVKQSDKIYVLSTPSGAKQYFEKRSKNNKGYKLRSERKNNTCQTLYEYDGKDRLQLVKTINFSGHLMASVSFSYAHESYNLELCTSDGRKISYLLEDGDHLSSLYDHPNPDYYSKPKKTRKKYLLKQVIRSSAPNESYEYSWDRVVCKHRPNDRFLQIGYYEVGKNRVGGCTIIDCPNESDPLYHRVKLLKAPVGADSTPIITHRFFYKAKKNEEGVYGAGRTDVYDAAVHKTSYLYDKHQRLTTIKHYQGDIDHKVYSVERFLWGLNGTENSTNLLTRSYENAMGWVQLCRSFFYDNFGNVVTERLYGNLTGYNQNAIIIQPDGYPINNGYPMDNGCEFFQKTYSYSQDGLNLLLGESDGNKTMTYQYAPETDLMTHKYVLEGSQVKIRHFYDYDSNGVVIREITDDGGSLDRADLSGVTERHIRCITPRTSIPFGAPAVIEEKCLDVDTGQEILLKRVVNEHSTAGDLIRQDHYDSNGAYAYSLFWEYDGMSHVTFEKDALGNVIRRNYDENGNLVYEAGPSPGSHKEYVYDYSNRLVAVHELLDSGPHYVTSYRYDTLGNRTASIDTYGNETQYAYDEFGRLIQTIYPVVPDENGSSIRTKSSVQYDPLNNPTVQTNPNGSSVAALYTIRGQPYQVTSPDGRVEKNVYALDGRLLKSIASNGSETHYVYDYLDRVIKKTCYSAAGELLTSTATVYNAFHLLSEIDALGHETRYGYDSAGRVAKVVKGDSETGYAYDSLGRVQCLYEYFGYGDRDFSVTAYSYDALNRVIDEKLQNSLGNLIQQKEYVYDAAGNCTKFFLHNQAGTGITTTSYNFRNEPCFIVDAEGNATYIEIIYSAPYKKTTDPLGNTTTETYDAMRRLVSLIRTNPFGQIIQKREFRYDAAGSRTQAIDIVISSNVPDRSIITSWKYDNCQRLICQIEALQAPEQKITHYLYNHEGQKEATIKPDGIRINHAYDLLGRITAFDSSDKSFSYTYQYDANSNLIKVCDLLNNTATIKTYDGSDRLAQEILGNGLTVAYTYDRKSRPKQFLLPDGSSIQYTYSDFSLKEVARFSSSGEPQYVHSYIDYDTAGNPIFEKLIGQAGTRSSQLDLLNRVIKVSTPHWDETLTSFDPLGNLLQRQVNDSLGLVTYNYTYDRLSQIQSEEGIAMHTFSNDSVYNRLSTDSHSYTLNSLNQLLNDGTNSYRYDPNGNLVQKGSTTYAYDALDRLISVANDSEQVSYTYDELNRRLSKKVASSSQQTEERYLYAGQDEIGACDPQGNIAQLRVLGIGRGAEIGAAIAIELNGQAFAPIHDHNGNVASLLDNVGNVFETYRYSAFGEEQIYDTNNAPIDASINPWRFSSKRFDPETGFINFGRRYYSPSIGRFVTADPIGYEAGPNLYAYVLNNPLTHLDLYGLWATPCDDDRVINVLRERDGERHRQFEAERRENYYNHFGVHDFRENTFIFLMDAIQQRRSMLT